MTTDTTKTSSRDRLLDAAATLAYLDGVGVGVEALCKAAGVSKRSMYQLFESKDELLAASLERRAAGFAARFLPGADDARTPRERILGLFEQAEEQAEEQAAESAYRGCPFLAVQIELKDVDHPASRVAHRIKEGLTAFFRDEAERGGASDPDLLARQLSLVFDGASARAGIQADSLAGLLLPTVVTLLDAAGVR
ncbi:TetR/AcrR family transcriptional regulator [Streptomyces sp. NPDC059679]|uniref:TetR/AcrR family transcriptional regulator n=1 Tax=Streptomyces sp. NPDC059679 TaxID=3346903 RepID=UPI003679DB90